MAMFPIATKGYMPFVHGKNTTTAKNKRSKHHVNGGKLHKSENKLSGTMKMYQITVKDKKGNTYKYVVKADATKSLPELCETRLNKIVTTHHSMPDIGTAATNSPSRQRQVLADKIDALNSYNGSEENFSTSLDLRECGKKEGLFSAFIRFIKERTGKSDNTKSSKNRKSKPGKSKRKPKDVSQRKRQRTVSAMSNLDPIQESPNEHDYEDDDDADSYLHYSSSMSDSDSSSVASSLSYGLEKDDNQS